MRIWFRVLVSLLLMLAILVLASCTGAPGCPQAGFGGPACSQGGSGGLSGGGGGATPAAFVYAVDQTGPTGPGGTINGFVLTTTGTFGTISGYTAPVVPLNSGGAGMVVAQKKYLYAGFGSTGQLFAWSIDKSGKLTTISGSPYSASFLGGFIGGVGQANMITNPAGTLLFISDAVGGTIFVFQIGSGGALTAVTGSPFPVPATTPVFTPMNLATDGLGNYLYVVNGTFSSHTGSQVAAYTIGSGTNLGMLMPVPGSPFTFKMWQLRGDPTGKFMVGSSGSAAAFSGTDDKNLYVFGITQTGTNAGALTQVTKQATQFSPYSIAMQSNAGGNLIYSFSFNDTGTAFNAIEGYALSGTGGLSADTGSPFSGVGNGSWGQFDQSGQFMFVYASFPNTTTNTFTTLLTPLHVAANGGLTQPVSTFPLVTPGFWVVTDPQ